MDIPRARQSDSSLLTVNDLARLLRVPRGTIYAWRTRGEGPKGLRIGRHVRFRLEDVEAWLRTRED